MCPIRSTVESRLSPSVRVLLDQLSELGISKTEFARLLGVSPDYVYRILKGRVPFPHVRETIERMAEICRVDPHVFAEYREMEQALPPSTRLVWQRMKELGMSREDFFQALGGRISRPYFNSVLRGDQPFFSNRAYIQLFALALQLPPTVFKEFGRLHESRWTEADALALEQRVFDLLFDKMMADYGFSKVSVELAILDTETAMRCFPPREALGPAVVVVLERMGELGMGLPELEKISGVEPGVLRELFMGKGEPATIEAALSEIKRSLRL